MENERIEHITAALAHLAFATQAETHPDTFDVYVKGLEVFDTATVSEACLRLAASEKRFPPLAAVRAMCYEVTRVEATQQDAEYRTEVSAGHQPISKARARLWLDHLKAVLDAKNRGLSPPPKMIPIDSSDPRTFHHCHACRDTQWVEGRCPGGRAATCGGASHNRYVSVGKQSFLEASCRAPHVFMTRCHCAKVG